MHSDPASEELTRVFRALSDETRLRMLRLLLQADSLCVCDIMTALGISQTRASRNLNILKNAGLLKSRRIGTWMYYSVDRRGPSSVMKLVARRLKALKLDRVSTRATCD